MLELTMCSGALLGLAWPNDEILKTQPGQSFAA